MWLVPRSAQLNVVGVEPKGSKCNLKNLECTFGRCTHLVAFDASLIFMREGAGRTSGGGPPLNRAARFSIAVCEIASAQHFLSHFQNHLQRKLMRGNRQGAESLEARG